MRPATFRRSPRTTSSALRRRRIRGAVGGGSPRRSSLTRVVDLAGVPAEKIAYVGDRVDNDVGPAIAAGMTGVHIRRGPWGHLQEPPPAAIRIGRSTSCRRCFREPWRRHRRRRARVRGWRPARARRRAHRTPWARRALRRRRDRRGGRRDDGRRDRPAGGWPPARGRCCYDPHPRRSSAACRRSRRARALAPRGRLEREPGEAAGVGALEELGDCGCRRGRAGATRAQARAVREARARSRRDGCVLASNTSSIPITAIARAAADPSAWSGCTSSTRRR